MPRIFYLYYLKFSVNKKNRKRGMKKLKNSKTLHHFPSTISG